MFIGDTDESGNVGGNKNAEQPIQVAACVLPNSYNLDRPIIQEKRDGAILRSGLTPSSATTSNTVWVPGRKWRGEVK